MWALLRVVYSLFKDLHPGLLAGEFGKLVLSLLSPGSSSIPADDDQLFPATVEVCRLEPECALQTPVFLLARLELLCRSFFDCSSSSVAADHDQLYCQVSTSCTQPPAPPAPPHISNVRDPAMTHAAPLCLSHATEARTCGTLSRTHEGAP
jgi:hypothetical protein